MRISDSDFQSTTSSRPPEEEFKIEKPQGPTYEEIEHKVSDIQDAAQKSWKLNVPEDQIGRYHTVEEGETLRSIAKEELGDENRVARILELNNLKATDIIHPGQEIRLSGPSSDQTVSSDGSIVRYHDKKPNSQDTVYITQSNGSLYVDYNGYVNEYEASNLSVTSNKSKKGLYLDLNGGGSHVIADQSVSIDLWIDAMDYINPDNKRADGNNFIITNYGDDYVVAPGTSNFIATGVGSDCAFTEKNDPSNIISVGSGLDRTGDAGIIYTQNLNSRINTDKAKEVILPSQETPREVGAYDVVQALGLTSDQESDIIMRRHAEKNVNFYRYGDGQIVRKSVSPKPGYSIEFKIPLWADRHKVWGDQYRDVYTKSGEEALKELANKFLQSPNEANRITISTSFAETGHLPSDGPLIVLDRTSDPENSDFRIVNVTVSHIDQYEMKHIYSFSAKKYIGSPDKPSQSPK